MTADKRCAAIARSQFGLITRAQAFACGIDRSQVTRRIETGRWQIVLPGVYQINGTPRSWKQDAMAGCLWAGDEAALSHRAAARLWRFTGFESAEIEVSTTSQKRNVALSFAVHRVRSALLADIHVVHGIPVTSVRWTLLDLAGMKHPRAEGTLDQALARESTSLGQIWRLYEEEWTRRRRGIAILRSFLDVRTPGNAPDDSELERLLDKIIRDFSLPEPTRQFWIDLPSKRIRVDHCYPEAKLVIECDSYAYHSDREKFESDRTRDNELQLIGWRILRLTWAQLRFEPERVAALIREHLAQTRRVVN